MPNFWTDLYSFVTGGVRFRDLACLALVADELAEKQEEHSYFFQWDNGDWGSLTEEPLDWTTVDATVCATPIEQVLFLGLRGEVFCAGSGDEHEEQIGQGSEDSPLKRGMMRGLGTVDGKAYAVGMGRQVYRRDAADHWVCIDHSARDIQGEKVRSFECVTGFSGDNLLAAGRGGEIWMYDGDTWKQQPSPTNMILTDAVATDNGDYFICGRMGTLIMGNSNRWSLLDEGAVRDDFWGLAWFDNQLYLSTMRAVYRLNRDYELERVDFGLGRPTWCFALSSADGVLWSIGAKDILSFDGEKWSEID